jgi:hypothetical protein
MSFNIEVEGGSSVRLPTAGKYCDRDIVITALGGGGGSMEYGEFVGVQGSLNIPVSSKKTHFVMYPKNVNDENGNNGRISYLFANEANFQVVLLHNIDRAYGNAKGDSVTVNFTDTNITFNFWDIGAPCNTIPFYWFAW